MLLRASILLLFILTACGKDLPALEGVDTDKWKSDKNACLGERRAMEESLRLEMGKLKGLAEDDILKLLGRPDANELYKRNQKFYYYFLSPGPNCTSRDSITQRLVLRFNAMGYAQAVSIERI